MVSHTTGKEQVKKKKKKEKVFRLLLTRLWQLLDGLINTLLGALTDAGLRIMCLRGLANIVGAGKRCAQCSLCRSLSCLKALRASISTRRRCWMRCCRLSTTRKRRWLWRCALFVSKRFWF